MTDILCQIETLQLNIIKLLKISGFYLISQIPSFFFALVVKFQVK